VFGFMPQSLYPWRKHSWYFLDRRLGGPQGCYGYVEKDNVCDYRKSNPNPLLSSTVSVATLTEISQLLTSVPNKKSENLENETFPVVMPSITELKESATSS
jgi:hypothetical protein